MTRFALLFAMLIGSLILFPACGDSADDDDATGDDDDATGDDDDATGDDDDATGDDDDATGDDDDSSGDDDDATGDDDDSSGDDDDSAGDDAISPSCDSSWAGCTENDFAANDFTSVTGDIFISMVPMQNYDPPCLTVAVGQTVSIQATGGHPFLRVCAEDSVMDSQNLSTSDVTFTFTTPGFYNYECQFHSSMKGNIKVVP